ncbi:membrane-bound PQQ-dependent dehydrogenase, glucose/quinate/shikimate family [Rubrivivax gelatinosus]|uniref:Quinoprotein glucose dehydrogenase n=1 Tax=Rubrivivax gelatinosus TaxID=28068 RepID=A0A4R2LTK8_RUBGE|nr:membrane-bound PQQ-dependent dehydrogenase, glucose/quinate/shikimate family [Rubrivivax gelatinosus]MBK1690068.1 membrane-bound PQQ-dependent dehydrogenase, glucose/quinate/shikimate family [Rubrivivax gelatinosus]TCO96910.1 quinoprotein glucose dehydrogenase [Rubrivivax gelatinosus]
MASTPRPPVFTGSVVLLAGIVLLGGGAWLAVLGGSWYYAVVGAALLITGALLVRGQAAALAVYAAVVGGTLAWSLWEVGLDWWPLAARGDVLFVLGLWLLTPWVRRGLAREDDWRRGSRPRGPAALLAVLLAAFALVAAGSALHDPHDLAGNAPPPLTRTQVDRSVPEGEWHAWGRTNAGRRYSPLPGLTPQNVTGLEVAWHYRTADLRGRPGEPVETTYEVTPLKIGHRLVLCTPQQSVIALDATTGAALWRRQLPIAGLGRLALQHQTCRGLSYRPAPDGSPADAFCAARLFMPTIDGRVHALDLATGRACEGFGSGGSIDLWDRMPERRPGAYYSTSPVAVAGDRIVVGGTVLDNVSVHEASGVIRAFDAETGALLWNWDPARPDDTAPLAPGETYTPSSPNSWSVASVDEALGLVYLPMGNQPPDQWGAERGPAAERFASSVVALELATGRVRWVFQTVHHDLWDYDVPSQPSLLELQVGNRTVPALVQPTKQGEIFVLDRRSGLPLLPVTQQPAPQGAAPGERTAATQPVSALSLAPPPLGEHDMWGATMFDQLACRIAFRRLRYEGRFTPPSTQGTLVHPGNFGVFNWGSVAVDPLRQIAFTTPTYLAFVSRLVPRPDDRALVVQDEHRPHDSLPALNENFGAPYAVQLSAFTSPLGIPCQAPPWGYVAAVDLVSGQRIWQHRNGTVRDLAPLPLPFRMGVPSLGGPLLTGGGLAFLSGTLDDYVRAYDVSTGAELWRARLPAGGQATPMSYEGADGRQYVVVVAGGHGSLGTRAGDHVIAYALPR